MKSDKLAAVTNSEDCDAVQDRLDAFGEWISALGDMVIGPGEEYQVVNRGVQGFKDVSDIYVEALVASDDMPRSIMMGETPGGLNSGENAGDWQAWTSSLNGTQVEIYEPRIDEYLEYVFAAAMSPVQNVPDEWEIEWPELFQTSELDQSTVLLNTMTAAVSGHQANIVTLNEARSNEVIAEHFPAGEDTFREVEAPPRTPEEESEVISLVQGGQPEVAEASGEG